MPPKRPALVSWFFGIYPSLQRWLWLAVYSVTAAFLVYLILPALDPLAEVIAQRLALLPFVLAQIVVAGVVAAIPPAFSRMYCCRWTHLRQLRHPTWIWAAVVGGTLTVILRDLAQDSHSQLGHTRIVEIVWPLLSGGLIGMVATTFINRQARTKAPLSESGQSSAVFLADPTKLDQWASSPEEPVNVLHTDAFEMKPVAARLAMHLNNPKATRSIGLVGPYGSGKTSILKAVETLLLQDPKCLVVWAPSWGTSSGTDAAEMILRGALNELSRHVDCLSVANVPSTYTAALKESGSSLLRAALALLSGHTDAEATLKRLDNVLHSSGYHMVILLEDLDRNDIASSRFQEVSGLLDRLKQSTRHFSFVLAVSQDARAHIDFVKLCDRYEVLTELKAAKVRTIVRGFVEQRIREYPNDLNWYSAKKSNAPSPHDRVQFEFPSLCTDLLTTPRLLHSTLRTVISAWPKLHGEVDLSEFISITALRMAAPPVFQFLITHIEDMRGEPAGLRNAKEHGEWLKGRWDQAVSDLPTNTAMWAEKTMDALFPGWSGGHIQMSDNPQSIHNGPHSGIQLIVFDDNVDYWQRIFAEDIDGLRDQSVAQDILKLKTHPSPIDLFRRLPQDGAFAERFERLAYASKNMGHPLFLDLELLYALAGEFHSQKMKDRGVAAEIGRDDHDGFHTIWRSLISRRLDKARHVAWTNAEIDRSLDVSLRLANSIEYWWGGPNEDKESQEFTRRHLVHEVQRRIRESGVEWLSIVLDPKWPWCLNHLVVHKFHESVFRPDEWRWILPTLSQLIGVNQDFIPHVASIALEVAHKSEILENGERFDFAECWTLDRAFLDKLIPDKAQQVLFLAPLTKEVALPTLDERANSRFRGLQKEIEQYIAATTTPITSPSATTRPPLTPTNH
jgi:hypothetical protein